MFSNIPQTFNYIVKNDIKPENLYNMEKMSFLIGHNKCRYVIVHKSRKNPRFVQYNLRERVTVIESICTDRTKLLLLTIFRGSTHHIRHLIHAEKEGKASLVYWKNACRNVLLVRVWLEHFQKYIVNKYIEDSS